MEKVLEIIFTLAAFNLAIPLILMGIFLVCIFVAFMFGVIIYIRNKNKTGSVEDYYKNEKVER